MVPRFKAAQYMAKLYSRRGCSQETMSNYSRRNLYWFHHSALDRVSAVVPDPQSCVYLSLKNSRQRPGFCPTVISGEISMRWKSSPMKAQPSYTHQPDKVRFFV